MKKFGLLFLFYVLLFTGWGQAPEGYYSSSYGKKGSALRVALYNIIDNHTVISYDGLWNAFRTTDVKPNGKVWDIYSDVPNGTPPYQYTFGVDQCGNYTTEGDCYNREHSVPKSWFNSASPMYSDLFHLYPTDGKVNQERGNYAFGEVGTPNYTSLNGSKRGNCDYPDCSGIVFEPINEYKGDLARSYFYMCTRYMDKNLGQNANSMFVGGNLDRWALNMLISWHQQDPVSQKEINRNNAIYQLQHNRNPFIDYPELVGKIFGSDSVNAFNPEGSSISFYNNEVKHFRIYPNPADKILRIVGEDKVVKEVEVLDMMGNVVIKHSVKMENQKTFVKDISHLTEGIYVVKIKSDQYLEIQKLMIQRDGSY